MKHERPNLWDPNTSKEEVAKIIKLINNKKIIGKDDFFPLIKNQKDKIDSLLNSDDFKNLEQEARKIDNQNQLKRINYLKQEIDSLFNDQKEINDMSNDNENNYTRKEKNDEIIRLSDLIDLKINNLQRIIDSN